jgi:hypothetical protein
MIARSHTRWPPHRVPSGRRNHDAHIGDAADLMSVSRAGEHLSLAGAQSQEDAALAADSDSEGAVDAGWQPGGCGRFRTSSRTQ